MAEAQTYSNPYNPDNIIKDQKSLAIKEKVLARQKTSSIYSSISKAAMYVGGLLTTGIVGAGITAMIGGGGLAALGGFLANPITMGLLAAGVAVMGIGIATDYLSSRIWQGCNFDNLEANAASTARHLVKELKVNNMCMAQQGSPCKEKDWAKMVDAQRQQQAATSANR